MSKPQIFDDMLKDFMKKSNEKVKEAQREHTKSERKKKKIKMNEDRKLHNSGRNHY